ncbi:hypothetical protein PO357_25815, partial [Escherichia coli]
KRVFLVILFTSFSGSLVSRIPGAVQYSEKVHRSVDIQVTGINDEARNGKQYINDMATFMR